MPLEVTVPPGSINISQAQWDTATPDQRASLISSYADIGFFPATDWSVDDDVPPKLVFAGATGTSQGVPAGADPLITPGSWYGVDGANNSIPGISPTDIPGLSLPSWGGFDPAGWLQKQIAALAKAFADSLGLDQATARVVAMMALGFGALAIAMVISERRRRA